MKLKNIFFILGLATLLGCQEKSTLTQEETEMLTAINFNPDLLMEIKYWTKRDFQQLPAIDSETGEELEDAFFEGVYSEANEETAEMIVRKFKPKFKGTGYLVFIYEDENGQKSIAVIKGSDELDILRYRRTDGINYDLDNAAIISKVAEWQAKYGICIIGCGRDWLHAEFDKQPGNMKAFAKEVYAFCPDAVDQGVGTLAALEQSIKDMHGVWLWWD